MNYGRAPVEERDLNHILPYSWEVSLLITAHSLLANCQNLNNWTLYTHDSRLSGPPFTLGYTSKETDFRGFQCINIESPFFGKKFAIFEE